MTSIRAGSRFRRAGNGSSESPAKPAEFTVTQLTSEPGMEEEPSLSPDGKWLVYVRGHSTLKGDVYLQGVGGRTPDRKSVV